MFSEVSSKTPSEKFAETVYFLHKEVGLSYGDVFGREETIVVEREVEREGRIGSLLDRVLGKRVRKSPDVVKVHGMNVKTLMAYMELMRRDAKEQERRMKKQNMRNKM